MRAQLLRQHLLDERRHVVPLHAVPVTHRQELVVLVPREVRLYEETVLVVLLVVLAVEPHVREVSKKFYFFFTVLRFLAWRRFFCGF